MAWNHEGGAERTAPPDSQRPFTVWQVSQALLLGAVVVAALSFILLFPLNQGQLELEPGGVSSQDLLAPRQATFKSDILTEEAKDRAAAAVDPVYAPPDLKLARQQVVEAGRFLDYLEILRHDPYASPESKVQLVSNVPNLTVPKAVISETLALREDVWLTVREETLFVINEVMRGEIRESQVAREKRLVPGLVSPMLPEEQTEIVTQLARNFITANTFYDEDRTASLREQARESVDPVERTIERGEAIVREGDVVDPLDVEALGALGMLQQQIGQRNIAGSILLISVVVTVLGVYLLKVDPQLWDNRRHVVLIALFLVLFAAMGKLMIPGHVLLPYLFPAAALPMLLAALLSTQPAALAGLLLSVVTALLAGGSFELLIYALAGSVVGTFALGRVERLNDFIWAGVYLTLTNLAVIFAFRLQVQDYDTLGLVQLGIVGVVNAGLSTSLALAGFFSLSNLFGIITSVQLMELARPTHPLLHELQLKAPGTYHHSILISNMAEQAAQRIGADALLVRVASYYHDIGKMVRPYFFIENQADSSNIHERLDAEVSAQIVISHVKDGLDLAKKHGLPNKIRDFIPQHHGTMLATYFYHQALEKLGDEAVDEADFRYPGPKPQTREAAIIMLADAVEAATRANRPSSAEELDAIVRGIIDRRVSDGQLDECAITLRDLDQARQAFVGILKGVHHPRIKYPGDSEGAPEEMPTEPSVEEVVTVGEVE